MNQNKRVRKTKPKADKVEYRHLVSFCKADDAKVVRLAKVSGMSVSGYLRKVVKDSIEGVTP